MLSNRSRGLCPSINKDRQTWPLTLTLTNSGCTSAAEASLSGWESKSAARFSTGPATAGGTPPGERANPRLAFHIASIKSWDMLHVLHLPAARALSRCLRSAYSVVASRHAISARGRSQQGSMSLVETATRARTRRRMGMRRLCRLIILMNHLVRRLGDTVNVSLYRLISYFCRLPVSGRRIGQLCVSGKAVGAKALSSITCDAVVYRVVVRCGD